jgi:hypothetical protein
MQISLSFQIEGIVIIKCGTFIGIDIMMNYVLFIRVIVLMVIIVLKKLSLSETFVH